MAAYPVSTAYSRMFFMVSSSDHLSAATGLSPAVNVSKAGAAFGAVAGSISEIANGWYVANLTNADTNTTGDLAFHITASGADSTDFVDQVGVPVASNVTQWSGGNVSAAAAGIPDVNIKNIGNATVSTTAAQLGVNVVKVNNVATTSVTTINANLGTTQAITFDANNFPKVDLVDIAGATVSAATAQLGVNVVNWNNTVVATPATAGIPDVNIKNINNTVAATPGASGGILISGSNAGTTTFANITVTGNITSNIVGNVSGTVGNVTGTASVNVTQVNGSTTGASNLGVMTQDVVRGTVTSGASTTSVPTSALTGISIGAANQLAGRTIMFDFNTTTTALQGASVAISASTNSSTPTLTVGLLPATPASGDTFSVI